MPFDKTRCLDNIYALAKEQRVKIGDLEKDAGMSTGYLSRLRQEGNTTLPSIDALTSIAEALHVQLDTLVYTDVTELTATESYILKLLDKLQNDTETNNISWSREDKDEIEQNKYQHPLFRVREVDMGDGQTMNVYVYRHIARTDEEDQVEISGDFLETYILDSVRLYLTDVCYNGQEHVHEVFLDASSGAKPICSTAVIRPEIARRIDILYSNVEQALRRPTIDRESRGILDRYIMGLDEDIPF